MKFIVDKPLARAISTEQSVIVDHGWHRQWTHVCPNHTEVVLYRVCGRFDVLHDGVVTLRRSFNDVAIAVHQPPVVDAGDATLLYSSVDQGGVTVGTFVSNQAKSIGLVFENYEVFAKHPDELGW